MITRNNNNFFKLNIIAGLVLLILAHLYVNLIWLSRDNFPLWFDYGSYFKRSIDIFYASGEGIDVFLKSLFASGEFADAYRPYRIVLPLSSLPWYYFFGVNPDIAVIGGTVFLALALISTYLIANRIFANRSIAFLAAFILSTSPGFFIFSRRYSPEFGSTALVGLAIYLLLKTEYFSKRGFSLLAGFTIASSILVKEMSFAFVFPVLLYTLYKAGVFFGFENHFFRHKLAVFINFLLFFFSSALVIVPFYWLNRAMVIHEIFNVAYSDQVRINNQMIAPYGFAGITFYLRFIFEFGLLSVYSFFSLVGLFLILRRKIPGKGILFFWIFGSYLILLSAKTRCFEYSMPMIIPLSILVSYAANTIFKSRIFRRPLVTILIFWGIIQFWFYTSPIVGLPDWCYRQGLLVHGAALQYHPRDQDWRLAEIVEYITANNEDPQKSATVHVGANLDAFSAVTLNYVAAMQKAPLALLGYNLPPEEAYHSDFVVIKGGEEQGVFYTSGDVNKLVSLLEAEDVFIELPKRFPLPDGSFARVYKKTRD